MGMDKEGHSKDDAHDPDENPQRMAVASTILPLAFATSTCGGMGVIPICNIPNKLPMRSVVTRLKRLAPELFFKF